MKLQRMETTLLLSILLLAPSSSGFSAGPNPMSKDEGEALSILFDNFETVFHTVPALLDDTQNGSAIGFMREPFDYAISALDQKSPELRSKLLGISDAVLLGTKDYAPPDGLGRVLSTRCYIAVLRDGQGLDYSKYLGAPALKTSGGEPIWSWSADLGEFGDRVARKSSLYATKVGDGYFVVANSLSELQSVSYEISSPRRSSSLVLSRLDGWDTIEVRQFWAYRRYVGAESRLPATIFNGLKGIQPEARGLILYADLEHKQGILRILTANNDYATAEHLHEMWRMPDPKSIGNGEWEVVFPFSEDDPQETSYQVWWLFGLGVAV